MPISVHEWLIVICGASVFHIGGINKTSNVKGKKKLSLYLMTKFLHERILLFILLIFAPLALLFQTWRTGIRGCYANNFCVAIWRDLYRALQYITAPSPRRKAGIAVSVNLCLLVCCLSALLSLSLSLSLSPPLSLSLSLSLSLLSLSLNLSPSFSHPPPPTPAAPPSPLPTPTPREVWDVWCPTPPVWNLRAVIWSPFPFSSLFFPA